MKQIDEIRKRCESPATVQFIGHAHEDMIWLLDQLTASAQRLTELEAENQALRRQLAPS